MRTEQPSEAASSGKSNHIELALRAPAGTPEAGRRGEERQYHRKGHPQLVSMDCQMAACGGVGDLIPDDRGLPSEERACGTSDCRAVPVL